ncbi:MAG TPA: Rossmann-like and DUF2520 domain-containing protein [Gemmatimonadales bacterium]|nr:Rossmann-like and DUF2520 domain-containing protein [Gemmatimonadales bacterium]
MSQPRVTIIGAGRMGQGLGLALKRRGYKITLVARSSRDVIPPLVLHAGSRAEATAGSELVLIATPDDAIGAVAAQLAAEGAIVRDQVVLHLSGLLDRTALLPLEETGAGLGSFHPLQSVAEPGTAAERLKGAYVGIEGDDRALTTAERLANTLRMIPVRIPASAKPAYHAGAAFVANYTVALVGVAERLARGAGVPADIAARIYLPLLGGAVANLNSFGPAASLTGAVRRGDETTVRAHLSALGPEEQNLYRTVGKAAVMLAREAGLSESALERVEKALDQEV